MAVRASERFRAAPCTHCSVGELSADQPFEAVFVTLESFKAWTRINHSLSSRDVVREGGESGGGG
eukprot:COSAG03_NODE_25637_length_264_cov_0.866667_1_plen_64_part_10